MKFFYFFVYSQKGLKLHELFHDGGRYHIETSCSANQWTGFYIITASVMKGLNTLKYFLRLTKWNIGGLFLIKTYG